MKTPVMLDLFDQFDTAAAVTRDEYLPAERAAAIAFYDALLDRYHAAVLASDEAAMEALDDEAHRLARKANDGHFAILGGPEASGYWLPRETAAPEGTVPRWGQQGSFVITVPGCRVRITTSGLFGHGFAAHAVDWDLPFISPTGYTSLSRMQNWGPMPVDAFARQLVLDDLEGRPKTKRQTSKLVPIEAEYQKRYAGRPVDPEA